MSNINLNGLQVGCDLLTDDNVHGKKAQIPKWWIRPQDSHTNITDMGIGTNGTQCCTGCAVIVTFMGEIFTVGVENGRCVQSLNGSQIWSVQPSSR